MKRERVKLTLQQAEQVEWALGPMADFWCTEAGAHERDGKVYWKNELPALMPHGNRKTSKLLELSEFDEINTDLLYRLEVQLQDMSSEEPGQSAKGIAKAARNAALRIRHRLHHLTDLSTGGGWI